MTDLQFLALVVIGFGALCAIALCLVPLWMEPRECEKIDTDRL